MTVRLFLPLLGDDIRRLGKARVEGVNTDTGGLSQEYNDVELTGYLAELTRSLAVLNDVSTISMSLRSCIPSALLFSSFILIVNKTPMLTPPQIADKTTTIASKLDDPLSGLDRLTGPANGGGGGGGGRSGYMGRNKKGGGKGGFGGWGR